MSNPLGGTHAFTAILADVEDLTEWIVEELERGGCGDGVPWSRDGVVGVRFLRAATSLAKAIAGAIRDVERAGFRVERIVSDPDRRDIVACHAAGCWNGGNPG